MIFSKMNVEFNLDSAKHVYNPRFRTFHITMEHIYGEGLLNHQDLEWMGDIRVRAYNPITGNRVVFNWVGRGPHCNLYGAVHDGVSYSLMVWLDISTMRRWYDSREDVYATVRKSPQLVTSAFA